MTGNDPFLPFRRGLYKQSLKDKKRPAPAIQLKFLNGNNAAKADIS